MPWWCRLAVLAAPALATVACAPAPVPMPPVLPGFLPQLASDAPPSVRPCPLAIAAPPVPPPVASRAPTPQAGSRFDLPLERTRLALAPGRWAVRVALPPSRTVILALEGPARALRSFDVLGRGALASLRTPPGEEELPVFVSFDTDSRPEPLLVVADVDAPFALSRLDVAPFVRPRTVGPSPRLPLVGMPTPRSKKSGYRLTVPTRYAFLRSDAAEALRASFRQVRSRFGREAIALSDASQWNGDRPASDHGLPRHIGHHEGREVDVGLPGDDGDSSVRHRCKLVLTEPERATCEPGSIRGLDAERLAYLLALLVEGPTPKGRFVPDPALRPGPAAPVEAILADAAVIEAVRAVLPELRRRRWIHDQAVTALADDRVFRASPWHTDHVHVRFAGEAAQVPDPLVAVPYVP